MHAQALMQPAKSIADSAARDSIFTMGFCSRVGVYYTAGRVCSQKASTKVSVWSANASVINLRRPRAARCSPGRKLNYMHYRSWYIIASCWRERKSNSRARVYQNDIHHIVWCVVSALLSEREFTILRRAASRIWPRAMSALRVCATLLTPSPCASVNLIWLPM